MATIRYAFASQTEALEYALKVIKKMPSVTVRVKEPWRNLFAARPEWHVYVTDSFTGALVGGGSPDLDKKYNVEETRRVLAAYAHSGLT